MTEEGAPKLSLAMIVRDCAESLDKCLESIANFVDEIVLVNTALSPDEEGYQETNEIGKKYGAKIYDFPWVEDFSAARNFSFEKCTYDNVMWLDSDDIVQFPDRMRDNFNQVFGTGSGEALLMNYLYEFDSKGNCTCMLLRERIVDRRYWEWRGPIHECLCAKWSYRAGQVPDLGGRILHTKKREDQEAAEKKLERNLRVFKAKWDEDTWDKRTLYYWGNTLLGLKRYDEALEMYKRYLEFPTDNEHELYTCLVGVAEIHRIDLDQEAAQEYALKAMNIFPTYPSAKMSLAESYVSNQEWERALDMCDQVDTYRDNMVNELVASPEYLKTRPDFIRVFCYAQLGRFAEALRLIPKVGKTHGNDENFKAVKDVVEMIVKKKKRIESALEIREMLLESDHPTASQQASAFLGSLPRELREEPEIAPLVAKMRNPNKPTVAILTFVTAELWGPESTKTGIGGSEEAVINMSRELARLGWNVEVYAHTEFRGPDEHGVEWYPVRAWGGDGQEVDIAVFWRSQNAPRDMGVLSHGNYLWLHDVPNQSDWSRDSHDLYDKVMVLSEFHGKLHHWIPEERKMKIANGVDPGIFVPEKQCLSSRNPYSMIWPSDPSRGLQHLAPWWDALKEEFPGLEIHVFYGWSALFHEHRKRSKHHQDIYEIVEEMRGKDGVHWHGRVGQDEMNEWAAKCAIWPYMMDFPESFCINAIKMQAHGCWPVVPSIAAIPEVTKYGDLVEMKDEAFDELKPWGENRVATPQNAKDYIEALRKRLHEGVPQGQLREMIAFGRSWTWEKVARQWDEEFRSTLKCSKGLKVVPKGSFKGSPILLETSEKSASTPTPQAEPAMTGAT